MFHIRFATDRGVSLHVARILHDFIEPRRLGVSFTMEDAIIPGHPVRRVAFNDSPGPAIMDSRRILSAEF